MKLRQGQVWDQGGEFIRIVRLTRTEVEYKSMTNRATRDGTHLKANKKDFCRLIKNAILLPPAETPKAAINSAPANPGQETV